MEESYVFVSRQEQGVESWYSRNATWAYPDIGSCTHCLSTVTASNALLMSFSALSQLAEIYCETPPNEVVAGVHLSGKDKKAACCTATEAYARKLHVWLS